MYNQYSICYPMLNHPLAGEKTEIKIKYVCLLHHYQEMICEADLAAEVRLDRFSRDFLSTSSISKIDYDVAAKEVMKTRFTPFKFFSYRYIFLFDCVFLFALEDKEKAKHIATLMKSTVHQKYHKKIDLLIERLYEPPYLLSDFPQITDEMQSEWKKLNEYISSAEKKVVFTATMSAGKSTLINALIGRELTNTKKAACTATVMDFAVSPMYHNLYHAIDENYPKYNVSCSDIKKITTGRETPLSVIGYFESCLNKQNITLIDTPGVNSSLNPEHKKVTREALQNQYYDVIVYVIPVENYGSENDYDHLQFIKQKASYGKIIFAVNMMDTCDLEDDSVSEIVTEVSEHLVDIGFENPIICPISAKAGLLFKEALTGIELTENEEKALIAYYRKYAAPEYDLRTCYNAAVELDLRKVVYKYAHLVPSNALSEALISTGLPQFEQCIMDLFKEV